MSIAKATILTATNTRLNRTDSAGDIDNKIVKVIMKIVGLVPGIAEKTAAVTVLINTYSIALPTGFAALVAVANSSGQILEPVDIKELLAQKRSDTVAGTPVDYAIFGNSLYVHPTVSAETVLTLFEEYFDTSAGSINLPDEATEALIEGVCALLERDRGVAGALPEAGLTHEVLFKDEISILQALYERRRGRK